MICNEQVKTVKSKDSNIHIPHKILNRTCFYRSEFWRIGKFGGLVARVPGYRS
jgi:hypothetical protein